MRSGIVMVLDTPSPVVYIPGNPGFAWHLASGCHEGINSDHEETIHGR